MKIRNGFVSNSSSSSFVIAVKTPKFDCARCEKFFKDALVGFGGDKIADVTALAKFYDYSSVKEFMKDVKLGYMTSTKDRIEALNDGYVVYIKNVDCNYSDDFEESFYKQIDLLGNENVKILSRGYD